MSTDAALLDLAFLALDHGIGSISDAGGETLIPFVLTQDRSGRHLRRFVADTLEESVAAARSHLAGLPTSVETVALAFDGFVTIQGTRSEAIIVQAQRRGFSQSANYAQRYQRDGSRIAVVGNAAHLGEADPLF